MKGSAHRLARCPIAVRSACPRTELGVWAVAVSYPRAEPDYNRIKSLTYATATPEDKAKTRASWSAADVIAPLAVSSITSLTMDDPSRGA